MSLPSLFEGVFRLFLEDLSERFGLEPVRVHGVVVVYLVSGFVPGKPYFFRVDYDDEVAGVDVGGEDRLVLAAQYRGDAGGHPPEGLAVCVH